MRGADTLTEREGAILRLVADGLSNRDIAARLALSVNTVKWYVQQVYQKLGVRRRTQAVVLLRQSDEQAAPDLPAPLTPLVGREHERAEVLALLQSSSTTRLVSLVGAGGIGKTRLAQAIASTWRDEQPDEVCWVSLDGLAAPDQIIPAIGATLGFQFGDRADLRSQLMAGLRHRHLLLVLDNFEHLLDAAPLVSDLLAAAPGLRVLATSRERLNLRGEVVYRLDGRVRTLRHRPRDRSRDRHPQNRCPRCACPPPQRAGRLRALLATALAGRAGCLRQAGRVPGWL